jgi:hypothetical protein
VLQILLYISVVNARHVSPTRTCALVFNFQSNKLMSRSTEPPYFANKDIRALTSVFLKLILFFKCRDFFFIVIILKKKHMKQILFMFPKPREY